MPTLWWLLFLGSSFPVSEAFNDQLYPSVISHNDTFYVFWLDLRYYPPDRSVFAARIANDGTVIDPEGREILRDRGEWVDAAFDGVNFLVAIQDSC